MLHNEEDYPEPSVFKPERFIKDGKLDLNVRDPALMAFGFGRRFVSAHFSYHSRDNWTDVLHTVDCAQETISRFRRYG